MDVRQELQSLREDAATADSLVNELTNHIEECKKKIHIVKVVELAMALKKLFNDGLFEEFQIGGINLAKQNDNGEFYLTHELFDIDEEFLPDYDCEDFYAKLHQHMESIFDNFNYGFGINNAYINDEYVQCGEYIPLKPGFEEEILNVLLSKELKAIVDHSDMQNELEEKITGGSAKKFKI